MTVRAGHANYRIGRLALGVHIGENKEQEINQGLRSLTK